MGLFNSWSDGASVVSRKSHKSHKHHKRDSSRSRSHSRERHSKRHHSAPGLEGLFDDGHYSKHNTSRGSFFGLGNGSSRSIFSTGRSPSYYKRSPRPNFVARAFKRLKRMLRDLLYWAKRHPVKVFMLILVPLITGGVLTALLARFGLRLPARVERMIGFAAKTAGGSGGAAGVGLMGKAVSMVTGRRGNSSSDRGYDSDLIYETRRSDYSRSSSKGGGGGFFGKVGEFFS
ncbi:hypothetical protein GGR50DRAFT_478799 [Xylaria sp. CBS 124048]|nr:hypothetical protein GGR50DRAFT_478799 [Xylaria sp. CBS 124048]